MTHETVSTVSDQEIPLPISPGDVIVGDEVEIEFITYVQKTALVRFKDQFDREQSDGLHLFKEWLADQDELTIRRN